MNNYKQVLYSYVFRLFLKNKEYSYQTRLKKKNDSLKNKSFKKFYNFYISCKIIESKYYQNILQIPEKHFYLFIFFQVILKFLT